MEDKNQPRTERNQRSNRRPRVAAASEFDEKVLEVNRVTRVVKGGKRMRFRTLVVIGDHAGRIAYGLGKAGDVTTAVTKAVANAKKEVRSIYLQNGTLPYQVLHNTKSAQVLIRPAKPGTGLIAGGAMRIVLELAGVKDAVAKVLGSSNKISNVAATIEALAGIISPKDLAGRRGVAYRSKEAGQEKQEKVEEAV
jgi:small subunit ribosomal protein S5